MAKNDIINNLDESIESLEKAVYFLSVEATTAYALGDNMRGNIRHDAAAALTHKLNALKISSEYLQKALDK